MFIDQMKVRFAKLLDQADEVEAAVASLIDASCEENPHAVAALQEVQPEAIQMELRL